jgi:hypothetical protein
MCHELAHCEVGPHNAQFYKVMDEIMEQHAVFMVRGIVTDKSGFPIDSHDAHVLGGGMVSSVSIHDNRKHREDAATRRMQKQKMLGLGGSFRLGGGFLPGENHLSSLSHLPPKEAAKRAAERRIQERRQNDNLYCLPCQEVIDILDGSSDEEEDITVEAKKKKRTDNSISCSVPVLGHNIVILDDSDDSSNHGKENGTDATQQTSIVSKKNAILWTDKQEQSDEARESDSSDVECTCWTCAECTFINEAKYLACAVCGYEQNRKQGKRKTRSNLWDMQIEALKAKERENSFREFGGFNIYGNSSRSSRTLDHIT